MTWTPIISQQETWTTETLPARVFDPAIFDNDPIFDTGSVSGIWNSQANQTEVWTPE